MTIEDIQELVNKLTSQKDRASGALSQIKERLLKEHGSGSIKEAKALLAKLEEELAGMEQKYEKKEAEFKEKWGPYLEELE